MSKIVLASRCERTLDTSSLQRVRISTYKARERGVGCVWV
jgi:hypothetical protein